MYLADYVLAEYLFTFNLYIKTRAISMKLIAALSASLFFSFASLAQSAPAKKASTKNKLDKTIVYGTLTDAKHKPVKGMKAFVYKADSTIVASGYTDATGYYETNQVPAGTYFVKFIYPTDKVTMVYNIEIKKAVELNYSANAPVEDTMIAFDALYPKKPGAKK